MHIVIIYILEVIYTEIQLNMRFKHLLVYCYFMTDDWWVISMLYYLYVPIFIFSYNNHSDLYYFKNKLSICQHIQKNKLYKIAVLYKYKFFNVLTKNIS